MARLNLASKIAILTAALLVCLGAVMLVTFSVLSTRQINRTILADANSATQRLFLYLDERTTDLAAQAHRAATGDAQIIGLFKSNDAATVAEELPKLQRPFSVDALQFLSSAGTILAQSQEIAANQDAVKQIGAAVIASGEEEARVVQAGSQIYLMASAPVRSQGYTYGAITLIQDLGTKEAKALARQSGDELGFTIGGRLVACSIDSPIETPDRYGIPFEQSVRGEVSVCILEPLPQADSSKHLGLLVFRSTQAIGRPYVEARNAFVTVLTVSLFLSIAGGIAFGRGLAQPISTLADAAKVIESGEWPKPFDVQRQDEIGVLQRSFNDMIQASKSAQERLLAMIDLDPLTELLNHRSFRERLSQETRRCEASGERMSVAIVDIDHFADMNVAKGVGEGDRALRQIANVIRDCVPDFAILSRYAGDQFAAILPNTDAESVEAIMNYVRVRLQQAACPVTISVGCSEFPKNSSRENGLILAAELAMERAKQLGRNKVCLFDAVPGADKATDPFLLYQSLENGSFATIQALAAAVDAKDTYTNGHSERVANYASQLSTALGDPPEMVDRVFRCGTLHDVGKIGVPDAILKKPDRLDPDEQRIMETHPVLGELIAGKVPQLGDLLPGVRNHHERWDGNGYPDRLKGEQIPYIARVLAVADSYDAMTSDRPYRKGLSNGIALAEIEKSAGAQFDPKIAAEFVKLFRK